MSLTFDPEKHEYRVDGRVVPGVTKVLAPLYSWGHIKPEVLQAKQELGKAVHFAVHLDKRGCLDESSVDPQIAGYLDAYRKFRHEKKPRSLLNEQQFAHPVRGYAGTLDDVSLFDDALWFIDWKATVALYPQTGVQLAAYRELVRVSEWLAGMPELRRLPQCRCALQLKPNGKYQLESFQDPGDLATFIGLLAIYHWRNAHGIG
jgi:hypothetical protein